jgi:hypothetical protein
MDIMGIVLVAVAAGLAVLLFIAIAMGWLSKSEAGPGFLTAYHDFQPLDRQRATEIVIEQKAGKRWTEQERGDAGGTHAADHTGDAAAGEKEGPRKGHQGHES